MFGSTRWLAALALAGILTAVGVADGPRPRPVPASTTPLPAAPRSTPSLTIGTPPPPNLGGYPINPNPILSPGVTLGQAAYNTSVLGRALSNIPPYVLGYNPYLTSAATGPALAPYSISTTGGFNPYLGGASTLSTSPGGGYSLSTTPSDAGIPYGGYGAYTPPFGAELQGYASLTRATGQYWKDMSQARLGREVYLQASLDTARKRVEFERWYESQKLTAPQMRDREMATDLDRARKSPPPTEIWSGKALNELLRSVQNSKLKGRSTRLDGDAETQWEETLKRINLSDNSSRGNVGMLKDSGNLDWPESLKEAPFDKARTRLGRSLRLAVDQLKHRDPLENSQLKDIKADFKELNKVLNESADNLSPAQYIEAKRYLNQLSSAIRALSDKAAVNYFNGTWVARGVNVADLMSHMSKEGLTFAPATPGDEAAYNALYLSLRNLEAGLQSSAEASDK